MPIHDWTRVDAGIFHDLHNAWITEMRRVLNKGILPAGYFVLSEQTFGPGKPDVLTLHDPSLSSGTTLDDGAAVEPAGPALLTAPPQAQLVVQAEAETYTANQRTLVIRHRSGHRIVALIEIVSAGNKEGYYPLRMFIDKMLGALRQGIHLLIVDLQPATVRDPHGIHGILWGELTGTVYEAPTDADRTIAAYSARLPKTAYVDRLAVGQELRSMPLFLSLESDGYVEVPLEATYQAAYDPLPLNYRRILEAPAPQS